MSLRRELVKLASGEVGNVTEPADRFGISRETAYMWLGRFQAQGVAGLANCSRRPHASPRRLAAKVLSQWERGFLRAVPLCQNGNRD